MIICILYLLDVFFRQDGRSLEEPLGLFGEMYLPVFLSTNMAKNWLCCFEKHKKCLDFSLVYTPQKCFTSKGKMLINVEKATFLSTTITFFCFFGVYRFEISLFYISSWLWTTERMGNRSEIDPQELIRGLMSGRIDPLTAEWLGWRQAWRHGTARFFHVFFHIYCLINEGAIDEDVWEKFIFGCSSLSLGDIVPFDLTSFSTGGSIMFQGNCWRPSP